MITTSTELGRGDYGPPRLTIELANICNLHCSYCLREEDALYAARAEFFPIELLTRILKEARPAMNLRQVNFTGGEPTLHPEFREILKLVRSENLEASFITNGWNFEKLWPALLEARDAITHVAFSLDGISAEEHDRWRGTGSFVRLIRAFSRCAKAELPFVIKVGIRRDTLPQLEKIALFAARMGASSLSFSHLMPTSSECESESSLNLDEQTIAEQEIASLARIFKMKIGINVGYYNTNPAPPCSPLAGVSANVDYQGRLTLCCNLSGFRNAVGEEDVVADLKEESFATAHKRLAELAHVQLQRRAEALQQMSADGHKDLYTGSPCLFCLRTFGKTPWHNEPSTSALAPEMTDELFTKASG